MVGNNRSLHKVLIISIFLINGAIAWAQNSGFVLRGKVYDSKTNAPVANVSIYLNESFSGTTTNTKGSYQIRVPSTPATLVFSCIGYTRRYFTFAIPQSSEFNVPLDPSLHEIPEVLITAKRSPVSISDEQDIYVTDYEFKEIPDPLTSRVSAALLHLFATG